MTARLNARPNVFKLRLLIVAFDKVENDVSALVYLVASDGCVNDVCALV